MSKVTLQNCPICSSSQLAPLFSGIDYSHTKEEFEVEKCADCGFVFTQNAPDENNIGKYYESEDYVSHSDTQKGLFFKIYHAVRNYMLGQKRKMIEQVTDKGKLLDIGCGTGYFLNEMQVQKWEVTGIEQDEQARKYGSNKFNINVKTPAELFELESGSFTAISMWHVLEHVHNLDGYLKQIYNLLESDGTLAIAVPNHDSHDGKHYGKHWAAWDLPIHLWHFTPDSMEKLMKKYGFKIIAHKRLPFDSFYVSMLSEKYKKRTGVVGQLSGIATGLISFVKSLSHPKKCSSVVYLIKKQSAST